MAAVLGRGLATLARLCVLHHTGLAYPHQRGMLRFLNDHTLRLAEYRSSCTRLP